jgi:hypothetical protein
MARSCPTATAIPLDQLWKTVGDNCLTEKTFRALQEGMEFPKAEFHARQMCDTMTWAYAEFRINIIIEVLMCAFNCSRCAIHSALANEFDQAKLTHPTRSRSKQKKYRNHTLRHREWLPRSLQASSFAWIGGLVHFARFCRIGRKEKFPTTRAARASFTSLSGRDDMQHA